MIRRLSRRLLQSSKAQIRPNVRDSTPAQQQHPVAGGPTENSERGGRLTQGGGLGGGDYWHMLSRRQSRCARANQPRLLISSAG